MGMSAAGGSRAVPYINVTPLIDVLLVLLIIFMVITPLRPSRFEALAPEPPRNEQQLLPNPDSLKVTIGTDLRLTLNDREQLGSTNAPNDMATRLAGIFQQRLANGAVKPGLAANPTLLAETPEEDRIERTVFIKAPRTMRYEEIVKVIDALKGAGARPIGLQLVDLE